MNSARPTSIDAPAGSAGKGAGASPASLFAELAHLSVLEFTGADCQAFLHGQLTCDVKALAAGEACFGGYCSPKGRLLATFWLAREGDAFVMLLSRSLAQATLQRLCMFVLRSKVVVRDAGNERVLFGAAGPDAGPALRRVGESGSDTGVSGSGQLTIEVPVERRILVTDARVAPRIRERLAESLACATAADWELLDIAAGIPLIGEATRDQLVPQMVNLDLIGGVSFTKGCYPGQEVVARSHYLGKVKRRMFLASLDADSCGGVQPAPGDALFSEDLGDQASGLVVAAGADPQGGHRLLAVTQLASRAGSVVRLKSTTGPALRFHELPYAVS